MTDLLFDDTILPEDHRSGFIAVIGRPNVGKSTLMNAYLGQKIAIVSAKAQTTRNQLLGILTLSQAQLIFVDTPGIHEPHHKFGEYLVEVALRAIPNADLILCMVDGSEGLTPEDELVFNQIQGLKEKPPVVLVINKIDLLDEETIQTQLDTALTHIQPDVAIAISALNEADRAILQEIMIDHLPEGPRFYPPDQVTDQQTRFIAAELVREAALRVLHKEVPHALAVVIYEFKERPNGIIYIDARLFVERDSQKGIVIGRGGKTLKKIGQIARSGIEDLVQGKVFLELRVKVRPKWRKRDKELKELGYLTEN